jgi:hypothetical protein
MGRVIIFLLETRLFCPSSMYLSNRYISNKEAIELLQDGMESLHGFEPYKYQLR